MPRAFRLGPIPLLGLAACAIGSMSAHAWQVIPQTPSSLAPYLELPRNGAVFVHWASGDAQWIENFEILGSRNAVETGVTVDVLSPHVARVLVPNVVEGDQVAVRVLGGEVEMPWLTWTVTATDTSPPSLRAAPIVRAVFRPTEELVAFTATPSDTVFISLDVDAVDDTEVVALALRADGAWLSARAPTGDLTLTLRDGSPGVTCVELVVLDAAMNEAATELCVPVPSLPSWAVPEESTPEDPPGSDDDAPDAQARAADRSAARGCTTGGAAAPAALLGWLAWARRRARRPDRPR